ncbi:MAG: CRISPR-associated endonuclease Cas1 [Trueperaceae bacterium]|nr:CRISPR-associated endonuclease Cas1 [Trueperaceae bacterium]
MGTLYVLEQDVYISKDGGVLKVSRRAGRDKLLERPLAHVSDVVILGDAVITPAAIYACTDQGTSIHYLSKTGTYKAQIAPIENKNVPLRVKQYEAYLNPEWKHSLAKRFVEGKLHNAMVFAKRGGADVSAIQALASPIARCDDTESLRGLEGNAAKLYFSLIKDRFPESFAPESRTKRPPRDPANSLLSLAYTFLAKECQSAIRIAGLDPYIGFLHEVKYGRPALALDLMEEFRSILADSVTLSLFNRNMITIDMFEDTKGYPTLTDEGFKQFLRAWEERLNQSVNHPYLKQKLDYRQIMVAQARILGKHLMAELEEYLPFTVR